MSNEHVVVMPPRQSDARRTGAIADLGLSQDWLARAGLRVGGWYPGRLVAAAQGPLGTLAAAAAVRVVALDGGELTLDANPPLAGAEVVASRPPPDEPRVREWLGFGPGLEAVDDIAAAFEPGATHLARQDETDDALFYAAPRMVHHIDSDARTRIAALYAHWIDADAAVLDLCSSWVSHYAGGASPFRSVTGLGMNARELAVNPQLDTWVAHDLNRDPVLPFDAASFDAVTCTVSFEYLRDPSAILTEVARVLKPGGRFVNTFSDRCFPTKAIALWAVLHPFERLGFLGASYHRCGLFESIDTVTIHGAPRPPDDDYFGQIPNADPVFAICGRRVA
ncbi:MAG: class I SAM-dependent methyltransferase [Pseudomonadota bacterium]